MRNNFVNGQDSAAQGELTLGLQNLVDAAVSRARSQYAWWWKAADDRSRGARLPDTWADLVLLETIGAGIAAEQQGEKENVVPAELPLAQRSRQLVAQYLENPSRVMNIARKVNGPEQAVRIYTICRMLFGRTAGGRVFLADLAEALLLPVRFIRDVTVMLQHQNEAA